MAIEEARVEFRVGDRSHGRMILSGDWIVSEAARLDQVLRQIDPKSVSDATFDGSRIGRMDSTGAWLLLRTKRAIEAAGGRVSRFDIPSGYQPLFDTLVNKCSAPPATPAPRGPAVIQLLEKTGRGFIDALQQGYRMLDFLGRVTVETGQAVVRPRRELPFPSLVHQMEETGVTALPIVGLLSFLLGVVLAYQSSDQLRQFGAEIFTVNLVGISVLREIGVLMTAIIVAGRSGSAFTAQIGTMKVNQEIDAIRTIGLNTVEILVLPRVLALVITLPLLTFYANIMGLIGGAVMSYFDLGITFPVYLNQLRGAITEWTFWLGLIKAPVFAIIIALVGCFEGLRVEGSADSVGRQTTRSVVESIFLVILFDAAFSILFSTLGI